MTRLEQIAAVIAANNAGSWLHSDADDFRVAREWEAAGFDAAETKSWIILARCFDAAAARALADHGLTPIRCSHRPRWGTFAAGVQPCEPLGYHVANGDLSVAEAAYLAGYRSEVA